MFVAIASCLPSSELARHIGVLERIIDPFDDFTKFLNKSFNYQYKLRHYYWRRVRDISAICSGRRVFARRYLGCGSATVFSPICRKLFGSVLLSIAFGASATASAQVTSTRTGTNTDTSSNGSSTGVGNAGSFGIGSGTSDSISTATATSNGIQDSSTDNSIDNSVSITTVSTQDLRAANTNNRLDIAAGTAASAPTLQTGANSVKGSAFANYAGILTNGWNTAPAGIAQAATSLAVNGNVRGK